jgi:hypothetical protein
MHHSTVIPRALFRKILACLHPDLGVSAETLHEVFVAFKEMEHVLCGADAAPPASAAAAPRPWSDADVAAAVADDEVTSYHWRYADDVDDEDTSAGWRAAELRRAAQARRRTWRATR